MQTKRLSHLTSEGGLEETDLGCALLLSQQCSDFCGQLYTGFLLEVFNTFVIVMECINDSHSYILGGHQV